MNHIYRTLWNHATRTWQAVPETAQCNSQSGAATSPTSNHPTRTQLRQLCLSLALAWGVGLLSPAARSQSLPTGASVVAGQANIAQAGRVMTITQTTPKLATNWQSFNIGAGHTVNFVQPSASAVALMAQDLRIDDGNSGNNYQLQVLANTEGVIEGRSEATKGEGTTSQVQQERALKTAQVIAACLAKADVAGNCAALLDNDDVQETLSK